MYSWIRALKLRLKSTLRIESDIGVDNVGYSEDRVGCVLNEAEDIITKANPFIHCLYTNMSVPYSVIRLVTEGPEIIERVRILKIDNTANKAEIVNLVDKLEILINDSKTQLDSRAKHLIISLAPISLAPNDKVRSETKKGYEDPTEKYWRETYGLPFSVWSGLQ